VTHIATLRVGNC